ncbi:beta-ketoacyl-[acyl-carrier-protein] synthase family protein [Aquincola sp. S2]|uniref:Beta-ketoacyl-[acyl-carrier-protein] synthase family protein n=1 Tax=Pseudaquabacterium terrae TaxID=2732868 RepID=A0ABX2EJA5_9BURK|nr:beta-ketoacyl-[acyl-carrier-protein] synthase family protein [Aquabacterium terrae]
MAPVAVSAFSVSSALGIGQAATLAALREQRSGLAHRCFETVDRPLWIGEVPGVDEERLPAALSAYDCRNNRLAWQGLHADGFAARVAQARQRHGAERIAVLLGTSTSGILQTEEAYRRRDAATGALPADFHYRQTHNTHSLAEFVRAALDLQGPAMVVSTACSSSAKVFAQAARWLALGLVDAAVVGGVDSLCLTTLYGFSSLELLSPEICRPWDANRHGLSLGEAAAFALLERDGDAAAWLLGCGESSDGHHMSSPHPEGAGAAAAMRGALASARLTPAEVDYINLHGTATPNNDTVEDLAVRTVFGAQLPCSSTKGATGHTLGAAGGLEAVISMLALQHGLLPAGLNVRTPDPALRCAYLSENRAAAPRRIASNSFGFGGSNACLIFGREAA